MADVSKRLCKGWADKLTTIYNVPTGKKAFIKAATFCNSSASTVELSFDLAGTWLIYKHKVKAYDTITIPFLDQILGSAEPMTLMAGGGTIEYYISGREVDA